MRHHLKSAARWLWCTIAAGHNWRVTAVEEQTDKYRWRVSCVCRNCDAKGRYIA